MELDGTAGGEVSDVRDLPDAREAGVVSAQDVLAVGRDGGEEKRPVGRFGSGGDLDSGGGQAVARVGSP